MGRMDPGRKSFVVAFGAASLLFVVFSLPFAMAGFGDPLSWIAPLAFQFSWCAAEGWLVAWRRTGAGSAVPGSTAGQLHCRITAALTALIIGVSATELWLRLHADGPAAVPGASSVVPFGLTIGSAGVLLRLLAIHTLGDRFRDDIALGKIHPIEHGGVYSLLRHPGEIGFLLAMSGQVIAFRSPGGAGVLLLLLLPVSIHRMHLENRLLQSEAARFSPTATAPNSKGSLDL